MKITRLFLLTSVSFFLINCSSDSSDDPQTQPPIDQTDDGPITSVDDDPVGELSSDNSLLSFSVTTANNPGLKIDADVQVTGNDYKLYFPFGTQLDDLIVSFQVSEGASMQIGGVELTSTNSSIDFTDDFIATVVAEDGSMAEYGFRAESNFEALDEAIQQLMSDNNAPSMQLAITKNEKLVYQAQYGFADLNNTEVVTDDSVYRLASVSKTITAVTILRMVQDGLIAFNDTVFGVNGILENDFGTPPYSTNIENITVRHLLDHTSGFTNNPADAMFLNLDWTLEEVISNVLDNRVLETTPGETYSYSNFGYILLGRVVEKVSGMTYENYVKQSILVPLGITTMNIARNGIDEKWPNEVEYFSQGDNLGPYQYNASRCESMGGWTASATDLAKLMVGIDRRPGVADIINTDVIVGSYFGFGEWGFWGSLPGTSAVIYRINEEFNFSIIANTRVIPLTLNKDMQDALRAAILARTSWPEYDLFTTE
ncbi:MAG: serine hydrolase domain-containing protein [Croceivirga sp.]